MSAIPKRRTFTANYKLEFLKQVDACKDRPGHLPGMGREWSVSSDQWTGRLASRTGGGSSWGRFRALRLGGALAEQSLMTPRKVSNQASSDAAVPPELDRSLERLRGLMNQSSRLEEIWEHFDTALVEDDAFLRLGRRSENPTLRAVVEAVVPRAVQRAERLVDLRLSVLSLHGLWHGVARFEATWCVVIYFEAENRGLLVISKSPLIPDVIYARFSFPDLPGDSLSGQVPLSPSNGS